MTTPGLPQARCCCWLVPLALVLGCQPPTEITLAIATDIPCGELRGTAITVGSSGEIEGKDAVTVTSQCGPDGRIGSLVVVPSGASNEHVALKIAAGRNYPVEQCRPSADPAQNYGPHDDATRGCVVARRELSFIRHTPLKLDIDLRATCIGEPCRPDQTCVGGSCVSSAIPDENLCSADSGCGEGVLGGNGPPLDITAIWGRGDSVCAERASGDVVCWGKNADGEFGTGASTPASPVVAAMPGVIHPLYLETSAASSCLVGPSGTVQCAGLNDVGQLGDGTGASSKALVDTLVGSASTLSLSRHDDAGSGCAVLAADGSVWCWGAAVGGKLGNGQTTGHQSTPAQVIGLGPGSATAVSIGADTACVITPAGTVRCWGSNAKGQLGFQGADLSSNPVEVALPGPITQLSVGNEEVCAVGAGEVWCWGGSYLGDGSIDGSLVPTRAVLDGPAAEVGLGLETACARLVDGRVACWGRNEVGQLGDGSGATQATPVLVAGLDDARQLVVAAGHVCVLRDSGQVWCWGENPFGQVSGDGTTTSDKFPTPHQVPGL